MIGDRYRLEGGCAARGPQVTTADYGFGNTRLSNQAAMACYSLNITNQQTRATFYQLHFATECHRLPITDNRILTKDGLPNLRIIEPHSQKNEYV